MAKQNLKPKPTRGVHRGRKPKFRPEITRVKLNPEQAVLSCGCYWDSMRQCPIPSWARHGFVEGATSPRYTVCVNGRKTEKMGGVTGDRWCSGYSYEGENPSS